jgi:hypothetical protein
MSALSWRIQEASLPLRPISHRQDKLYTDQEDAGKTEDDKKVESDVMSERVDEWIRERTGNKVEGEVEVGLLKLCQQEKIDLDTLPNLQERRM